MTSNPNQLRRGTALLVTVSALSLATPALAANVIFSSKGDRTLDLGARTQQVSGLKQVGLDGGATVSILDAADYRLNADGTIDLYGGSLTVAAGAGETIVRMPEGVVGRVAGRGSAASFSVAADGSGRGHVLTGQASIGGAAGMRQFGAGEMFAFAPGKRPERTVSNGAQATPNAEAEPQVADMRDGGPVAAAENGVPVTLGDALAAAGASGDILAAARRVEAAAANPTIETFPSGDLALLVARAGGVAQAYGGTPFPAAQADIVRTYLAWLAGGGARADFLTAYAGFLGQYLDLLRAGAAPSSFGAARVADINAFLSYSDRTGRLAALSASNRTLAEAYLAFLRGGGDPDLFNARFVDLTKAYFAFVRGGGDPAEFSQASAATIASYIAFLSESGLVQQLGAADRALLQAYLANGGLAFASQYRAALDGWFGWLASGRLPSAYAALDAATLRAYLETLSNSGLLGAVAGERASFLSAYLEWLRGGGAPDAFAGLPANVYAGYAGQLNAYYAFLASGGLPSAYQGDIAQLRGFVAQLQAAGALDRFLGERAEFFAAYLAFLQGGGQADAFAGLNVHIFTGYAQALGAYYDYLAKGGAPSAYTALTQAQVRTYLAALDAAGASGAFLKDLADFYNGYFAFIAGGGNPDLYAGLPVPPDYPAYAAALNAYAAFLAGGGLPADYDAETLAKLQNYIAAIAASGQLSSLLGGNADLLSAYFAWLKDGGAPNGFAGLPVYANYVSALNAYHAYLAGGGLPANYTALTQEQVRAYLAALNGAGGLGAYKGLADFFAPYYAFLAGGGDPAKYSGLPVYADYVSALNAYYAYLAKGGLPSGYTALTKEQVSAYLAALKAAGGFSAYASLNGFFNDYYAFLAGGGDPAKYSGLPVYANYVSALNAYYAYLAKGGLPSGYTALTQEQVSSYLAALKAAGGFSAYASLNTFFGDYYAFLAGGGDPTKYSGLPVYADYVSALNAYYTYLAGGGLPANYTKLTQAQISAYLAALTAAGGFSAYKSLNAFFSDYYAFLAGGGDPADYAGLPVYATWLAAVQDYYAFLAGGGRPSDYTRLTAEQAKTYLAALKRAGVLSSSVSGATLQFLVDYLAYLETGADPDQFAGLPINDGPDLPANPFNFPSGVKGALAFATHASVSIQGSQAPQLDEKGALADAGNIKIGTAQAVDVGGDESVVVGRYVKGAVYFRDGERGIGEAGIPWVVVAPLTAPLPTSGRIDYDVLAATKPVFASGAGGAGSFDAHLTIGFGNTGRSYAFDGSIVMPEAGGDVRYDFATAGRDIGAMVGTYAVDQTFNMSAGMTGSGAACASASCQILLYGGFAGSKDRIGMTYQTLDTVNWEAADSIQGAVAFGAKGTFDPGTDPDPDPVQPPAPVSLAYTGGFGPAPAIGGFITTLNAGGLLLPSYEAGMTISDYSLDAGGGVTSFKRDSFNRTTGTMRIVEASGNADTLIGRWTDGTNTGASPFTLNANQGLHYMLARPVAADFALPTQGVIRYDLLAATRPTIVDGSLAPGGFTAEMALVLGATPKLAFDATVSMPGQSYRYMTPGGMTDPTQSDSQLLLLNSGGGRFSFGVAGVSGTNCQTNECQFLAMGAFAGGQDQLGLTYEARNDLGTSKSAVGSAIFGNGRLEGGVNPDPDPGPGIATGTYENQYVLSLNFSNFNAAYNSKVVYDEAGTITSYTNTYGSPQGVVSPGPADESGSIDGVIGWTRWLDTVNIGILSPKLPNSGNPIISGTYATALPTTGRVNYTLVGATRPTTVLGDFAPGTFSGKLAVDFATQYVGFDFDVGLDRYGWNVKTAGGVADPNDGGMRLTANKEISGSALVSGANAESCVGGGCSAQMRGALFGSGGSHFGIGYVIRDLVNDGTIDLRVNGVAAFGKGEPPAPPPTGNPVSAEVKTDMFVSDSRRNETMNLGTASGNFGSVAYKTDGAGEITGLQQLAGWGLSDSIGTAVNADSGGTDSGALRWTRWTNGTLTHVRAGPQTPIAFNANQGYHIIVGTPATDLPTSGQVDYQLVGGTKPTSVAGIGAPGELLSGAAAVQFGATPKLGVEMSFSQNGSTYAMQTAGGLANVASSEISIGANAGFRAPIGAYGQGVTVDGAACATCRPIWEGFLSGDKGNELALMYSMQRQNVDTIMGAAGFSALGSFITFPAAP